MTGVLFMIVHDVTKWACVINCHGTVVALFAFILPGSGATCLAHCDGSRTWSEVSLITKAVASLTGAVKDGRYYVVVLLFSST